MINFWLSRPSGRIQPCLFNPKLDVVQIAELEEFRRLGLNYRLDGRSRNTNPGGDGMFFRQNVAAGMILLTLFAAGCGQKSAGSTAKAVSASTVENVPKEDQLNTFKISPAAEVRLGIETRLLEKRAMPRKRMYGGEVTLPTGASLIVTAPLPGFLRSPAQGGIPKMGERVRKGQPIYELRPQDNGRSILSAGEKVGMLQAKIQLEQAQNNAEGQVQQTRVQVEAAKIAIITQVSKNLAAITPR